MITYQYTFRFGTAVGEDGRSERLVHEAVGDGVGEGTDIGEDGERGVETRVPQGR